MRRAQAVSAGNIRERIHVVSALLRGVEVDSGVGLGVAASVDV